MIIDMHAHVCRSASDEKRLLSEAARNGVCLTIVSSLGPTHPWQHQPSGSLVRECNETARSFAKRHPRRVRWLVYLNPQNRGWRKELQRGTTGGACGIKLWVSLKDARGRLDRTRDVLREAAARKLPVLLHTFNRCQANLPGEIAIDEFARLAGEVPEVTMIAAHAGGNWRQSLSVLRTLRSRPGTYVDISGGYPEQGMVEALVNAIGADRVLFGSDTTGRSVVSQLAKVEFAKVSTVTRSKILGKNAAEVFSLPRLPRPEDSNRPRDLPVPDLRSDHFCFCGRRLFTETSRSDAAALQTALKAAGVARAYAADLGSLYRGDLDEANREFLPKVKGYDRIRPLAVVDPRAHNWRWVLDGVSTAFAGVLVFPCLHNWRIDDPEHKAMFAECARRKLGVWINIELGDLRFGHSGTVHRPVQETEARRFSRETPSNFYVFQGGNVSILTALQAGARRRKDMFYEISRLTDCAGALQTYLQKFGAAALVLGSEYPLRHPEAVRWAACRELHLKSRS